MNNTKLLVIPLIALFFLSWSFFGNNQGFNYNAQSYFPHYSSSSGSGGTNWYVHASSGPMTNFAAARPTYTFASYYTTFGNYQYYPRFTSYGGW